MNCLESDQSISRAARSPSSTSDIRTRDSAPILLSSLARSSVVTWCGTTTRETPRPERRPSASFRSDVPDSPNRPPHGSRVLVTFLEQQFNSGLLQGRIEIQLSSGELRCIRCNRVVPGGLAPGPQQKTDGLTRHRRCRFPHRLNRAIAPWRLKTGGGHSLRYPAFGNA